LCQQSKTTEERGRQGQNPEMPPQGFDLQEQDDGFEHLNEYSFCCRFVHDILMGVFRPPLQKCVISATVKMREQSGVY
jgi:hypothetical protein